MIRLLIEKNTEKIRPMSVLDDIFSNRTGRNNDYP